MNKTDPPMRPDGSKASSEGSASLEGGAEAYARWLQHMQRTRGRHAAITRNLHLVELQNLGRQGAHVLGS